MSSPARVLSPQFILNNASASRATRVVLQIRDRAGLQSVRYSLGAAPNSLPFVIDVSGMPTRFNLESLRTEVGEVNASISTFASEPGFISIPSNTGLMSSDPKGLRILDVLVGFEGMSIDQYLPLWIGDITALPSMAPGAYTLRATDGMSLVRRLNRAEIGDIDLWGSQVDQAARPARQAAELASDMLVSASGDVLDAIDEVTIGYMNEANINFSGDRDIDFPSVDDVLMRHVIVNELIKKQDPKGFIEGQLLPIFGGFLTRDAAAQFRLSEFIPVDRNYPENRRAWVTTQRTIGDFDFVQGSISVSWEHRRSVRSVVLSYGLQVWDAYRDAGEGERWPKYENDRLYDYALRHVFEIIPGATDTESSELVDGRDVPMSGVYVWPSEADPTDDEIDPDGGSVDRLDGAPLRDYWGFPVPYQGERRSWLPNTQLDRSHEQRMQWDVVHYMHNAVYRYIRFAQMARLDMQASVQSRTGFELAVGDEVKIWSTHIPKTETGTMGVLAEDQLKGQVLSRSADPQQGVVQLGLSLEARNRDDTEGVFYEFENQIAHSSENDIPHGWGPDRQQFAFWSRDERLEDRYIAGTRDELAAYYYTRWWNQATLSLDPLTEWDRTYGYAWHYVRYRLSFVVETTVQERGQFRVGFRVSLLGDSEKSENQPVRPYVNGDKVLWSQKKYLWVNLTTIGRGVVVRDDSIMVPGSTLWSGRPRDLGGVGDSDRREWTDFGRFDRRRFPDQMVFETDYPLDLGAVEANVLRHKDTLVVPTATDPPFVATVRDFYNGATNGYYVTDLPDDWADVSPLPGGLVPLQIYSNQRGEYDAHVGTDRPYLNSGFWKLGEAPPTDSIGGETRTQVSCIKVTIEDIYSDTSNVDDINADTTRVELSDLRFHRMRFYLPNVVGGPGPGPIIPPPFLSREEN